jgi:hypothetical protein
LQSGTFLGTINTSIKAFHQTGGQVRFFEKGSVSILSSGSGRDYGFTFLPTDSGVGYCIFYLNSAAIDGNCNYCFAKLNNEDVSFIASNSASNYGFSTTLPGSPTVVDGLFENLGVDKWFVEFKNNIFSYTGIDLTKVDLTLGNTVSSINFIGNNVVENLAIFDSKQAAVLAGLPSNSVILKRVSVTAGAFVVGQEYKISTLGTTDFTLIGASANTVGLWFTATDVGVGTGTAYLQTREII